jgi:hypothetical protein
LKHLNCTLEIWYKVKIPVFWFVVITLMMEAVSTSETSENYQTTQRNSPENSHLKRFIRSDHIQFSFLLSILGSEILQSGRDKQNTYSERFNNKGE